MQTSLEHSKKFTVKLTELQKKWYNFSSNVSNRNENIEIFAQRNFKIRSPRYWFYLLHTTGTEHWNLFVEHCIREYGYFYADFSGFVFDEKVDFHGFNFDDVDFSNSIFKVPANFKGAKFQKLANFSTSIFSQEANFQDTCFATAIFAHVQFQSSANFNQSQFQEVNFRRTHFQKKVDFAGGVLKKVHFAGTTFPPNIDFSKATFSQPVNFKDSNFQQVKNIIFRETKFLKQVDFQKYDFPPIDFSGAEFQQAVDFSQANFRGRTKFSQVKFLHEVKFLRTNFQQEVYFQEAFFERGTNFIGSVFYQNADFQKIQSNGELYFDKTLFKGEAVFKNYHLKNFTSFKKACFEQLVEFGTDEDYNGQLIDFTGAQIYFNHKTRWTTDYETLLKIQQLRHLAWKLNNKKLDRNLSQLERLARRGVKLKQLLSQVKNFWRIDKKNRNFLSCFFSYFFRSIFFIFFAIPWSIRLFLFWPLGQLSIFFYGSRSHNNYIRTVLFLVISYPIFYFLYTQTALLQDDVILGSCNRFQTYSFVLQHYLPFVDHWYFGNYGNITAYLQSCFAGTVPPKTQNIVTVQSIFSILLAFFTLLPLFENLFNRIRFAIKKTPPGSVPAFSNVLSPTEKTAILALPDSDKTLITVAEQPNPEIRKIRDEDIIDSPGIEKKIIPKVIIPPNLSKPIIIPKVPHKPYLFVPDPNFISANSKERVYYDRNFRRRFSLRWPYPLLTSILNKNQTQEPEVETQTGKVEEFAPANNRQSFRRAEYHSEEHTQYGIPTETQNDELEGPVILHRTVRGKDLKFRKAEYHSEEQTQYDVPTETQNDEPENPVILHRTVRDKDPNYRNAKYAKESMDRIRQIRAMGKKK